MTFFLPEIICLIRHLFFEELKKNVSPRKGSQLQVEGSAEEIETP
jgi:hypothetical protein